MDHAWHDALAAVRQRFRRLATQFRQNHAAWQEAVRVHDHARQEALIAREQVILTEVSEALADFQALIAQRQC